VAAFTLTPGTITPGHAATVRVKVTGRTRTARMRLVLLPAGGGPRVAALRLGWRRLNRRIVHRWALDALPAGGYIASLGVVDRHGLRLRRTTAAPGRVPVTISAPVPIQPAVPLSASGVFPVAGTAWSFGGAANRFGAGRTGHIHQGQDILAACGTPIRAPFAGTIIHRAVQDGGAGHYLVEHASDGRDYVFMHLVAGSETVSENAVVRAGGQLGQVGDTGDAQGCHLHFEIWPDGWWAPGSSPIDPLPDLEAWSGRLA
jgi:murein DD-endopeptidase MepM/ murein hydrolase activator NlpD